MKIKLNKIKEAIEAVINEQDLKKGDRISFKSDPKAIWTILGIQGGTYRINQQGERSISYQPKAFLDNMIATGKASIDQNESINLKEEEDSNNKGYIVARDLIAKLRATTFRKFNDDELEEFRKTIANAFDMSLKEGLINEQADYKYLTQVILDANPKMNVYYSSSSNAVNIGGVGYDKGDLVKNFNQPQGSSGKIKSNFYYANKDPQVTKREVEKLSNGKIKVDIQKGYGDEPFVVYSITESLNEDKGTLNKIADMLDRKFDDLNFDVNEPADRIDVRGSQQDLANFGSKLSGEKIYGYEVFATDDDDRGEIVRIVKSDSISRGGVNEKKDDRCTRIAKRKYDTWPSAYASGAVVRCRKGEIWKDLK